jgi:hypothetical protein
VSEHPPCPLCGSPLYGWIVLPPAPGAGGGATPLAPARGAERVLDRCEVCGVALEQGREVDLGAEWEAICRPAEGGGREVAVPNRASVQAGLAAAGWAAIDRSPGSLLLTPRSLELLAERTGHRLERLRWPRSRRAQAWMWQTLLNGLTFHPNFAREVRERGLRPAGGRGRLAFAVDAVVTVLGAPLVALISVPLEFFSALGKRGGEMRARLAPEDAASRNGAG